MAPHHNIAIALAASSAAVAASLQPPAHIAFPSTDQTECHPSRPAPRGPQVESMHVRGQIGIE